MSDPRLRELVDECVRSLNNLVVGVTREGVECPPRLWKHIENVDLIMNMVQDAIPVRTIVRYPAFIDVHVESTGDEHAITKTTVHAAQGDAGTFGPQTRPYVWATENQDVADGALRSTEQATWPDPKLES